MIYMKNRVFYLKIIILILVIIEAVTFVDVSVKDDSKLCYLEQDNSYILVEKNIVNKSFVSYLYKNDKDIYYSNLKDYRTNEDINITDLIKKEKINEYNNKIKELLYLKYPKYIAKELNDSKTARSYVFRDSELVIYFNDYNINPQVDEILYLRVNYNEIKDYVDFPVVLSSKYENESGYNYTNSKKSVAFTFDDSPNKWKTTRILEYLNDYHFHATFFVVGEKMEVHKDLMLSIKNYGNEIGSHSYSHQNMNKMTDEEFIMDYNKMNNMYKLLFNENLKYVRPPYGIIKENQLNLVDTSYIMWSLDTNDWKYRNSEYIVNYVLNNIKDGDIILFHDTYESTVTAIEKLLPLLYSKGYQVMSVSELFELKNKNTENNKIYYNAKE